MNDECFRPIQGYFLTWLCDILSWIAKVADRLVVMPGCGLAFLRLRDYMSQLTRTPQNKTLDSHSTQLACNQRNVSTLRPGATSYRIHKPVTVISMLKEEVSIHTFRCSSLNGAPVTAWRSWGLDMRVKERRKSTIWFGKYFGYNCEKSITK